MGYFLVALLLVAEASAQKLDGLRPDKADVPYLRHGAKLVPLEIAEAKEEKRKDGTAYIAASASSTTITPMAEPTFLFEAKSIEAEKLTLYRLEVKNGAREVFFFDNPKKRKDSARPLRMSLTRLAPGISKLEVTETLPAGEYVLTPEGSNQVFLFKVI